MAKKRATKVTMVAEEQLKPDDPNAPDYDPAVIEVFDSVAGLPSETRMLLFRAPEPSSTGRVGRSAFVAEMEPGSFGAGRVEELYGGGKFTYCGIKDGEILVKGGFVIEGERIVKKRNQPEEPKAPLQLTNQADPGLSNAITRLTDSVEQMQRTNQQENFKMMMAFAKEGRPGPAANVDELEERIYARMERMRGMFSSQPDMMGIIKMVMEMTSNSEMPIGLQVIERFMPMAEKIATAYSTSKGVPAVPIPPTPPKRLPRQPASPGVEPKPGPDLKATAVEMLLSQYGEVFVRAASRNADPGLYADICLDNVAPDDKDSFKKYLEADGWFKELCERDPRCELQGAWWEELRGLILEGYETTSQPSTPSPSDGGRPSEEGGE